MGSNSNKYYMRRHPKPAPEIEPGVKTRAKTKTLALQKQPDPSPGGFSYLQLRSRRLQKPPAFTNNRTKNKSFTKVVPQVKGSFKKVPQVKKSYKKGTQVKKSYKKGHEVVDDDDGCFGENFEQLKERSTRESTPISLIRDPEIIRTPGSSTRPTCSVQAHIHTQNPMLRHIPTAHDMDEFFSGAEVQQQQQFIEKYNFDPVNDVPLPGRYEWVKLAPKS